MSQKKSSHYSGSAQRVQQDFPQFHQTPDDQNSQYSLHSYKSQQQPATMNQRPGSRPITASQRSNIVLNQQSQDSAARLPDINVDPRKRPTSSKKASQEALKRSSQSQRLDQHSIDHSVTVPASSLRHELLNQPQHQQSQSLHQNETVVPPSHQSIPIREITQPLLRTQGQSQRSDRLHDYDRKSTSKKIGNSSIPNEDIRSQILTDQTGHPVVDLPPPIKDPFMHSGNDFAPDRSKRTNDGSKEVQHSHPDLESSQIGGTKLNEGRNQHLDKTGPLRQESAQFSSGKTPLPPGQNKPGRLNSQNSSGQAANILIRTNTNQQKKRKSHQNQFKEKGLNDREVIDFLTDFCQTRVNFANMNLPQDFDSTDNLDSFLMTLLSVNQDNLITIDQEGIENLHLATGTRTHYCRTLIQAIVEFQNKEVVFSDALEFFQESMLKMIQVSAENQQRRDTIDNLEIVKQELTVKMFDYQKKLTDTSTSLLKLRQTEFEQSKVLAAVKKQLDHKKAECESLTYMIKNNIKTEDQAKQPGVPVEAKRPSNAGKLLQEAKNQAQALGQLGESLNADGNTEYLQSPHSQPDHLVNLPNELPNQNQNTQILQNQIQKLQIENRQNLDRISEMQIAFENKDRLIQHLEHNISEMLVEREKNVIRLKSEIVLLQNKVTEGEESFKTRLLTMRTRVETDEKNKVKKQMEVVNEQLDQSKRHIDDQQQKIQRLQDDYANLGTEFQNYRKEKVFQESAREQYLKEIESKYKVLSEQYSEAQRSMISKLDAVTSQSLQKQNENEVLFLRLKYLKQITDTLKRQKHFLMETLEKSKYELSFAIAQLEEAMITQNKSKSYLISVEKSIKQTKDMSELGSAALTNIENIVKFLKVEKMYELVFEVEQPTAWQDAEQSQETQKPAQPEKGETISAKQTASIKLEQPVGTLRGAKDAKSSGFVLKRDTAKLSQVNTMLDQLKTQSDLPVQFRAKHELSKESAAHGDEGSPVKGVQLAHLQSSNAAGSKKKKDQQMVVKNEEYYLEHCPVELCSILLKFIVQELCQVEVVQSVEQIPFSISRLLFLANSKSDLTVEKELFESYLVESKRILDDEVLHLCDQITTLTKLKEMAPVSKPQPAQSNATQIKISEQPGEEEPAKDAEGEKKKQAYNVLSLQAFEPSQAKMTSMQEQQLSERLASMSNVAQNQQQQFEDLHNENLRLKNELQQHQITLAELKQRQKDVQIGLAGEIVELQEKIEQLDTEHSTQMYESECTFRQETEKVKSGCKQREEQLVHQLTKLSDKLQEYELNAQKQQQLQQAKDQDPVRNISQQDMIQSEPTLLKKPAFDKAKHLVLDDQDAQKSRRSLQSLLANLEDEKNKQYSDLQQKFATYQANVQTYITIKESNRNTVSIVFDANESNQQMINESILKLYLQKIYQLSGDKFRLLSSCNFVREVENQVVVGNQSLNKVKKQADEVVMTKILLEVVEQQELLESKSAQLRAAINDGSSLLYDLLPSYLCFNLGLSGMATKSKIEDCKLLQRCGLTLEGVEYIITLLRHKTDPYVFMAIAINVVLGEEYVLELQQRDILTLIEGDVSLLENNYDSSGVQELILDNLVLCNDDIESRKFLACELKVYFNTVMQTQLQSKASTAVLQQKRLEREDSHTRHFEISLKEKETRQSAYALSSIRDNQVVQYGNQVPMLQPKPNAIGMPKTLQTRCSTGQQTEFAPSVLYEAFNQVFNASHKVSDLVSLQVQIEQSSLSNTLKLCFQDQKTGKKMQFCILASNEEIIQLNQDSEAEEIQDQVGLINEQDQYFVHSQCLNLDQNHIILICCERVQDQGLAIRMHDIKLQQSSELGLFQKSNGQMARLQPGRQSRHMNDQFRQMVYDLTFQEVQQEDIQQNQNILQSYLQVEEKLIGESKDPQLAEQQLIQDVVPKPVQQKQATKLQSKVIVMEALRQTGNPYARHSTNIESFKQLQERGLLLYRDSCYIRVSESLAQSEEPAQPTNQQDVSQIPVSQAEGETKPISSNNTGGADYKECKAVIGLCSLHIKDRTINIEVFLYRNQKISVTSSVDVDQLFLGDPKGLTHQLRNKFIKQIIERLFVLEVQGRYEMKIEQDAECITDVINAHYEKHGCLPGQEDSHAVTIARNRQIALKNYEDKTHEFQIEKGSYVQQKRAIMYSEYVTIGEHSAVFELKIYVLLKKEKKINKQTTKRLNTFGKTQLQIETQKLEQHIDECAEFESIYLETADPQTKDLINLLIDKKRLVQILVKDMTTDWAQLIINWRQKLVPYIKHCIQIDLESAKITLRNTNDISNLVVAHCQTVFGSKIADRDDQAIIETFKDECAELLDKQLVLQQEVDFAEFSYDIKMYQISKRRVTTDMFESNMGGTVTFAYHIEIFNINEPEKVFKYRMPVSHEKSNDPISFSSEVFNLVNFEASTEVDNTADENTVLLQSQEMSKKQPQSKQKRLMKRYIDNNLILTVQVQKFPALVSLMLVEASSCLSWNCTYEPTSEITSAGSFCVQDIGTLEKFFNSIYDSTLPLNDQVYKALPKKVIEANKDWNKIADAVPVDLLPVHAKDVDHALQLSVMKHRGILKINIFDKEQKRVHLQNMEVQKQQRLQSEKTKANERNKDCDIHEDNTDKLHEYQDLHGAYSDDLDCSPINHLMTKVDIRLKNVFQTHLISKVLLTDQNQTALCVKVATCPKYILLTIQNLQTMQILLEFRLTHVLQKGEEDRLDDPLSNIQELPDCRPHVQSAISTLNTKHIAQEMLNIHKKWYTNNEMLCKEQYTVSPIEKSLTLHRRVFYDDQRENLIIITAEVVYRTDMNKTQVGFDCSLMLPHEVSQFTFRLEQPEKKTQDVVTYGISELVAIPEFNVLNRADIMRLKAVAKRVLEEGTELQFKTDQVFPYSLHFTQQI